MLFAPGAIRPFPTLLSNFREDQMRLHQRELLHSNFQRFCNLPIHPTFEGDIGEVALSDFGLESIAMRRLSAIEKLTTDAGRVHRSMDEPTGTAFSEVADRLLRIEQALDRLLRQKAAKEYYTTGEVAAIVHKAPFTVREWCRHRRIRAAKRDCGRGKAKEWIVSHAELIRLQAEGLLPDAGAYRHFR